MLTLDTEKLQRRLVALRAEAQLAESSAEIDRQIHGHEQLRDWLTSPANPQRQLGHPLKTEEFERRLHKLLPTLQFHHHPHNRTKKLMVLPNRDPRKPEVFRCVYENGLIPEHSIMRAKTEDVRDFGQRTIDRKDLPKHEWGPEGWRFDEREVMPGYKRIDIPYGEKVRGWRTVLIRLIQSGLLTVDTAEREFGAADDAQWAGHVGKRSVALPW